MKNIITQIEQRPGMYFSPTTVRSLHNFLTGYQTSCTWHNIDDSIFDNNISFHDWVAMQENYEYSSKGWVGIIEETSSSDKIALEKFFKYYHSYSLRASKTIVNLFLPESYQKFG